MPEVSRRNTVLGSAAAGLAALTGSKAQADPLPADEPAALFGAVSGDQVSLPPLHDTATDLDPPTINIDPPNKRLGIAVVGLGHLAPNQILPAFGRARSVKVTALVSGESDKARAVGAQYGVPESHLYGYGNFDRLKDNPDVDIVYIVLPNSMHAEYTVRAAAAGKHVLCEKPMATSVADAERMISACNQAKRRLMIAYRMQYEPHQRMLIKLARNAANGSIRLIDAVNGQNDLGNGQWRQKKAFSGGGSLVDVGVYCLNAARYVTGEEPVEITARTTQPTNDARFREVEDIAMFTLRFPSGTVANCASGYSFHQSNHIRVQNEGAWFHASPAFAYTGLQMQIGRKMGQANSTNSIEMAPADQFAREMDAFAWSIRNNVTPLTPGEEGIQDLRIIDAIYQSAAGGGTVRMPAQTAKLDATRGPIPQIEGMVGA
jgi:predicted dehydrogenase